MINRLNRVTKLNIQQSVIDHILSNTIIYSHTETDIKYHFAVSSSIKTNPEETNLKKTIIKKDMNKENMIKHFQKEKLKQNRRTCQVSAFRKV